MKCKGPGRPPGPLPVDSPRFCVVTLRLFATRGFAAIRAKPGPTSWVLGFCPRSAPSALLTTAPRFCVMSSKPALSRVKELQLRVSLLIPLSRKPLQPERVWLLKTLWKLWITFCMWIYAPCYGNLPRQAAPLNPLEAPPLISAKKPAGQRIYREKYIWREWRV